MTPRLLLWFGIGTLLSFVAISWATGQGELPCPPVNAVGSIPPTTIDPSPTGPNPSDHVRRWLHSTKEERDRRRAGWAQTELEVAERLLRISGSSDIIVDCAPPPCSASLALPLTTASSGASERIRTDLGEWYPAAHTETAVVYDNDRPVKLLVLVALPEDDSQIDSARTLLDARHTRLTAGAH